ncbi:MAG: hypothetical protein E6R06_21130 [Mycobacterium sp.]|nr:MAG: hypothetical protein E6R06_21130 [Mycobacterium sp.]
MPRAALPQVGYRRPDRRDPSGLIVTATSTSGDEIGPFDFSAAPSHGAVRNELIVAFIAATGADGRWRSAATMNTGFRTTLAFLRSLDRLDIAITSLSEFGPEHWWAWRHDREEANRWPGQVNIMRVLLKQVPEVSPLTRRVLTQRTHKPRQRLYGAYSMSEFERIRQRAKEMVRGTERRISDNAAALDKYLDDGDDGTEQQVIVGGQQLSRGALLQRLLSTGRLEFGRQARIIERRVAGILHTGNLHPTYALFPTRSEILSLMVLLVCDQGYNLSTMESLTVPDLASGASSAEDAVFIAHLDKPRRGEQRFFTNSIAGGLSASLRQAISITAPARRCLTELGHPTDRLIINGSCMGVADHPTRMFVTRNFTNGGAVRRWDVVANIATDAGELLHLHFNRLRLSEQVINRKSSQNSDTVSEDIYRRPDALTAHLVQDVILEGQADAVAHATATVEMRYTNTIDDLRLSPTISAAVADGSLDTATGACIDFTHSPFTATGKACTASFLMCLACPNAVATSVHLPRLVLLHDALVNLASVDLERFRRRFSEHFDRLKHLLSVCATELEQETARRDVKDTDRALIERLLTRELDS